MIWALLYLVLFVTHLTKLKAYSLPYASGGTCRNTTTEYFVDNRCCSKCMPGTRATRHCTAEVNTVCEPCQDGTFSENFNYHPNCFRCSKCQENKGLVYAKQCTRVGNAVCVCRPEFRCVFPLGKAACDQCKKIKTHPTEGVGSLGTTKSDTKPAPKPEDIVSNENSIHPQQARTRTPTTMPGPSPSDPPLTSSLPTLHPAVDTLISPSISKHLPPVSEAPVAPYWIGLGAVAAVALLVLLTTTFIIRHRKDTFLADLTKPAIEEGAKAIHQCLLVDGKAEPSTSSSDSHSQASLGRSTGSAPDCGHPEHTTLPSPCVNLSITATFNCQLNGGTGSCSLPTGPPAQSTQPPAPPTDLPLSQEEELCSSCQQEEGKEPLWLAQESGKTVY